MGRAPIGLAKWSDQRGNFGQQGLQGGIQGEMREGGIQTAFRICGQARASGNEIQADTELSQSVEIGHWIDNQTHRHACSSGLNINRTGVLIAGVKAEKIEGVEVLFTGKFRVDQISNGGMDHFVVRVVCQRIGPGSTVWVWRNRRQ